MWQFRLQRVLDYRRRHEEEREHSLRQVQLLHQQEAARLDALQTEAQAQEEHLEKAQGTILTPAELQSWQRYQLVTYPAQADLVLELRLTAKT